MSDHTFLFLGGSWNGRRVAVEPGSDYYKVALPVSPVAFGPYDPAEDGPSFPTVTYTARWAPGRTERVFVAPDFLVINAPKRTDHV